MTTNYFKAAAVAINPETQRTVTNSKTFFFDDRSPEQIRAAFEDATVEAARVGAKVSVYRAPKIVGPWSAVPVVGAGIGELEAEPN